MSSQAIFKVTPTASYELLPLHVYMYTLHVHWLMPLLGRNCPQDKIEYCLSRRQNSIVKIVSLGQYCPPPPLAMSLDWQCNACHIVDPRSLGIYVHSKKLHFLQSSRVGVLHQVT